MDVEEFIQRWTAREGGAERANYQGFLYELCDVLGVARRAEACQGPRRGREWAPAPAFGAQG